MARSPSRRLRRGSCRATRISIRLPLRERPPRRSERFRAFRPNSQSCASTATINPSKASHGSPTSPVRAISASRCQSSTPLRSQRRNRSHPDYLISRLTKEFWARASSRTQGSMGSATHRISRWRRAGHSPTARFKSLRKICRPATKRTRSSRIISSVLTPTWILR